MATLNSGASMPMIGLGTWKSWPGQVEAAVEEALKLGYLHIDGARIYQNEKQLGAVLSAALDPSTGCISRKDLFYTSKIWNTQRTRSRVKEGCKQTLSDLGLDYLDLYLIHWPMALKQTDETLNPDDENENPILDSTPETHYLETWKAMEELVDEGLVKHIGLSNFNHDQIQKVLDMCRIRPAVLQIECHPYLAQTKLLDFCNRNKIVVTSYAPLGARDFAPLDPVVLLEEPLLKTLSQKYKKTPAQILLRFHVDRGCVVIPKTVSKERLVENHDILNFSLSSDDLRALIALDRGHRYYPNTELSAHPDYPFNAEY